LAIGDLFCLAIAKTQTFIVFIDGEVRERYDKFLNRVSTRSNNERNNKTFIEAFVKGPQVCPPLSFSSFCFLLIFAYRRKNSCCYQRALD
jgi:hypothetical protein